MQSVWIVQLACAVLFLPLASIDVLAGPDWIARHTGRIQSVRPSDGMLVIEELGTDSTTPKVREVWIRGATVVRIWRDPSDPRTWRERVTSVYQWPVGTFIVVIGRTAHEGSVEATRVEIPKIMSE